LLAVEYAGAAMDSKLHDGELLRRYAEENDEAAFAEVVERHKGIVWYAVRRVLPGSVTDQEDVFQASFIILMRKASCLTNEKTIGPWLHKVAFNAALKTCERNKARKNREIKAVEMKEKSSKDNTWDNIRGVVDEELAGMDEKFSAPILLCHVEGMSYQEAAEALDCKESTIRGRLSQGLEKLRGRLQRRGALGLAASLYLFFQDESIAAELPSSDCVSSVLSTAKSFSAGGSLGGATVSSNVASLVTETETALRWLKIKSLATFSNIVIALTAATVTAVLLVNQFVVTPQTSNPDKTNNQLVSNKENEDALKAKEKAAAKALLAKQLAEEELAKKVAAAKAVEQKAKAEKYVQPAEMSFNFKAIRDLSLADNQFCSASITDKQKMVFASKNMWVGDSSGFKQITKGKGFGHSIDPVIEKTGKVIFAKAPEKDKLALRGYINDKVYPFGEWLQAHNISKVYGEMGMGLGKYSVFAFGAEVKDTASGQELESVNVLGLLCGVFKTIAVKNNRYAASGTGKTFSNICINYKLKVAFLAELKTGGQAICILDDFRTIYTNKVKIIEIFRTNDKLAKIHQLALNDANDFALIAENKAGVKGIYLLKHKEYRQKARANKVAECGVELFADTAYEYADFTKVAINKKRAVVFQAKLDNGRNGLFYGYDAEKHTVISSKAATAENPELVYKLSQHGLNNHNQIIFCAANKKEQTAVCVLASPTKKVTLEVAPQPPVDVEVF
jgi:RNA polymerase sigma factor (sigma-70 family)